MLVSSVGSITLKLEVRKQKQHGRQQHCAENEIKRQILVVKLTIKN